jgi:EAL domain-containing protein (putative c-di-GMP-specific phosphodiesterase class I)
LSVNFLCASLDIDVIAEYVETKEQRDKLKQLGCRQYQGYLYSPALPPEHIAGYLQRAGLGETAEQKPDTNQKQLSG